MTTIDFIILGVLIFGTFMGYKRGFVKEIVSCVGLIAVVVLSFIFKDQVSVWMYTNLPFFKFGGIVKGVTVLNILLYEVIAFLVVFTVLMILYHILVKLTGLIERIFNLTIILGIFSSFLGAIVGFIEYVIITFIAIYVLSLPTFNVISIKDTKVGSMIIDNTPFLSGMVKDSMKVIDEFTSLKEKYKTSDNANEFNYETLDLFLKYKVISVDNVEKLVEKDKISIDNLQELLKKYKEVK